MENNPEQPRKKRKYTRLPARKAEVAAAIASSKNQSEAAKKLGVTRQAVQVQMKDPTIQAAIEDARKSVGEAAKYGLEEAMRECDEAIQFSILTENANARVKAIELKMKLRGLLIEKHQHMGLAPLSINISGIDQTKEVEAIDVTEDSN